MGTGWSKKVPLSKITAPMLVPKKKTKNRADVQLLSPKLCANLLRKSAGMTKHNCTTKELTFLQEFLSRSSNFKSVSDVKKCTQKIRICETEIDRALSKARFHPGKAILSKAAHRHLVTILNTSKPDLYFKFRHKKLLTHVILPRLENLSRGNEKICLNILSTISEKYRIIFQHKLIAKDLRRNPKGLASDKGGTFDLYTCSFNHWVKQ